MVDNLKQTNILLCGSSRVGKSTLINAICQRKLTRTTASLNSVTKSIARYSYECTDGDTTHETVIWDTPGIESWDEDYVRSYMVALIEQTQPLCMIYCASPGSFAVLDHVGWLLTICHRQNIFCALVCTNMWAGRNRQEIVDEFCRLLNRVHPRIAANKEGNITYYDNVALVTMVNSQEYTDHDFGVSKPPSGVDELIFGIGKSLQRDLMFAWFRTVSQNTSFWTKMSSKLSDLFRMPNDTFNSLYEHATTFLDFLYNISDYIPDNITPIGFDDASTTTRTTDDYLFHDAEMIDIPEQMHYKKLRFTFKSADVSMVAELNQSLATLGAISCKTEKVEDGSEQSLQLSAEFENDAYTKAVHDLCQLVRTNKIQCTIVDELSKTILDTNPVETEGFVL